MLAAILAGGTAVALLAILSNPRLTKGDFSQNFAKWYETNLATFPAVFAALVPAQVAFLGAAVLFALLDREGWRPRIGWVPWKTSPATVALAVLGTLGIQFAIGLFAERLVDEPSSSLKMIHRMFAEPQGIAAVGVGFMMSALPGVCEETLFRGFTQRGLLRRWPPALAIGVTSFFFALAHFDLQHSLAVIPLGVWLGIVAWKTGSVWPAALCHFTNNLAAFFLLRCWGTPEKPENPSGPVYYVVGAALLAVTILATIRLLKERPEGA